MDPLLQRMSNVIVLDSWKNLTVGLLQQYKYQPSLLAFEMYAKHWYQRMTQHRNNT